jgi:hypothetical protein
MAEEILVRNTLTKEMLEAGKGLIRDLDKAKFMVNTAMWLFFPESDTWKLIIVSPEVKKIGPTKVYEKIGNVISKMSSERRIALKDISVMRYDDPFISSIRSRIKTGKKVAEISIVSTPVNSHYIEDGLIYRST